MRRFGPCLCINSCLHGACIRKPEAADVCLCNPDGCFLTVLGFQPLTSQLHVWAWESKPWYREDTSLASVTVILATVRLAG